VLLLVALRARFAPIRATNALAAVLSELWPVEYAIGFAVLAWHYNPQRSISDSPYVRQVRLAERGTSMNRPTSSYRL
jgi:hypothetical protein